MYTIAEIDAGITKANTAGSSSSVTLGNLTASGLFVNKGNNSNVTSQQLYYKDLLINGATAIKVLTTEKP